MAKILIVDDSPDLLDFLSMIIKSRRFEVEIAISKKELINKLQPFVPDLILLDVKLGGDNGREICKYIKSKTPFRHIPIILMSVAPYLLDAYEECEANDILEKPFDIKVLFGKIEKQLEGAGIPF